MKQSIAAQARDVLARLGTASVSEIALELGVEDQRPIGQALGASVKTDGTIERLSRGVYRWVGDRPPQQPSVQSTPDDLKPLLDFLDVEAFEAVDLAYVARSQDEAFICIDRNGVAWKVEVAVSARML